MADIHRDPQRLIKEQEACLIGLLESREFIDQLKAVSAYKKNVGDKAPAYLFDFAHIPLEIPKEEVYTALRRLMPGSSEAEEIIKHISQNWPEGEMLPRRQVLEYLI